MKKSNLNETSLSRRDVLRGAFAVGCGLLLPLAVFRSPAVAAEAAAIKKVSKKSVQYQDHAKGEQKCSGCANFIAGSNTCQRVKGRVNPDGGCILWMKKV